MIDPRPLRELAEPLTEADVTTLSGVPAASLAELWDTEQWLDVITGSTLLALMAIVPGLDAYVEGRSRPGSTEAT